MKIYVEEKINIFTGRKYVKFIEKYQEDVLVLNT